MIGLVFLPSATEGASLVGVLARFKVFDKIFHVTSENDYRARLADAPLSVCFCSASHVATYSPSSYTPFYWVAVGKTQSDALSAFAYSAKAFIRLPINVWQLKTVIKKASEYHQKVQQRCRFAHVIDGLCKQYGVTKEALAATLRHQYAQYKAPSFVSVKDRDGWCRLIPNDILWVEACGDYMQIHLINKRILVRSTLEALLHKLGPQHFLRCNRSVVVNVEHVDKVNNFNGQLSVILTQGAQIKLSPRYQCRRWQSLCK